MNTIYRITNQGVEELRIMAELDSRYILDSGASVTRDTIDLYLNTKGQDFFDNIEMLNSEVERRIVAYQDYLIRQRRKK